MWRSLRLRQEKPVFDKNREQEKLEALGSKAHNDFNRCGVQELFEQIMSISRKRQYQLLQENGIEEKSDFVKIEDLKKENATVVFQGVEGAYSFAAMHTFFGDQIKSFHVDTWKDAMEEIKKGKADFAVLPIENSTAGIVQDIYDLLTEYDHVIVGEQIIPCEHVLMGLPGTSLFDIRTVYSHPQALMQCREIFGGAQGTGSRWSGIIPLPPPKKVAGDKDPSQAAIASRYAADHFGLAVLQEGIYSNVNNSTRFIIVTKKKIYCRDARKISVSYELPHESGSLYNSLSHFIYNGLNMTKIESRPIMERNWEYRFFVDLRGI